MDKNKIRIILIFAIFLTSLIASSLIYDKWQELDPRYSYCNGLLLENNVYKGQPYCEQPPMLYLISAPIEKLFGYGGIVVSSIIFNLTILGFLYSLLTKKDLISIFLLISLYSTLVYPVLLYDYGVVLAVMFLTIGLYYLNKNNLYLSSLFFTLSFLSKATALVVVTLLIVLWIYKNKKYKDIWKLYPGLLLFCLMFIIYPNFLVYGFISHGGPKFEFLNWGSLIRGIQANLNYLFIYILMLIGSASLFKKEKFLSITVASSFVIISLIMAKSSGFENGFNPYYLSVTFAIFLIIGINYFNEVKLNKTMVSLMLIGSILLFSVQAYDNHGYNDIVDKYTAAYEIFKDYNGSILINEDVQKAVKLNNEDLTVFPTPLHIDSLHSDTLLKWGMMNETVYEEEYVADIKLEYKDVLTKLRNKEYDLIIIGFLNYDPKDAYINYLHWFFRKYLKEEKYYIMTLPSPNEPECLKCWGNIAFFKNETEMNYYTDKLEAYVINNFEFFCERDKQFTDIKIITDLLEHNGINFNQKCESSADRYIGHTKQGIK